ncbi:MAG TPA: ROK family protein [Thermoleophilaceae bacterium]|jgi:glucokinase|nr:ROK family protein [Thermoleophilaceae bacterium]
MSRGESAQPGYVLAIDFGGTKIAVGTVGVDGELIASERLETQAELGPGQAVERALATAQRLKATAPGDCLGAGAVSPGIIEETGVQLNPNLPGWDRLTLPELLRDGLGVPTVAVANDVNAAALAETRWGALADTDVGLFVSLGTGVKAGIVIGGHVFEGAHGAAGEIGYSVRDAADGAGFATGHAPLEEFVGGRALGERAGALLGESLSAADLFSHPELPPDFLAEWLAELTMHVANLAIAIDPERIAVGGGLMGHAERILPSLRERVRAVVPFPPDVVPARFLHDGALRGAGAIAIDAIAAPVEEVPS